MKLFWKVLVVGTLFQFKYIYGLQVKGEDTHPMKLTFAYLCFWLIFRFRQIFKDSYEALLQLLIESLLAYFLLYIRP